MMRWIIITAAFLGLISVILGAAGNHLLAGKLTAETAETFDIALRYHQLYSILIFAMGLYALKESVGTLYRLSCIFFLTGQFIFQLLPRLFKTVSKSAGYAECSSEQILRNLTTS